MTAPKTRDEFLALPVYDTSHEHPHFLLALFKPEGGPYAARDDAGDWWGLEHSETGWARRRLPCAPVEGV